jgi:ribose/xylose/arabinose/galactoside ABC-type transport system permease subunit
METPLSNSGRTRLLQRAVTNLAAIEILPIIIALIAILVIVGIYEPRLWQTQNLINVLRNTSFLLIIALGQMLVLVIGGFDLSVGSVVALTSITAALTMVGLSHQIPGQVGLIIAAGIAIALIVGTSVGVVNGLCVAYLKVPPFMVTLATSSIATGIALFRTTGVPIYGMPDAFTRGLGQIRWLGLPVTVYLTIGLAAAVWWIASWTRLGRYIYAIGGNPQASRVSGIRVNFFVVVTYTLCGFLAAFSGILLTARVGSGEGTMGGTFVMESIAAAVLGGVSLRGGVGRVPFVIIGALFLSLVTNAMNILRIESKTQTIVVGIILIVAVALDVLRRRGTEE